MERYISLEKKLEEIQIHLDNQIQILDSLDDGKFHNTLIDIIHAFPESKELIQFIVSINDKSETKNEIFKDVIYKTVRDLVSVKQQAVFEIMKELKEQKKQKEQTKSFVDNVKEMITPKIILMTIAAIAALVALFIIPDQLITLVKIVFAK